jgi:ABC-type transport system involved in multi-copper enzyme maturation permease subunit
MSALLEAELLKLRTTRTFVTLVGVALTLSLLVVVLTAVLQHRFTERDLRTLFASDLIGLFILLLGVMGMAGEWRHRTITSSVLAAPDRLRLLGAKVISYTVAGAVLSLIVTVTIMIVGTIILSTRDKTTLDAVQLLDVMWRNLVTGAFLGALGVCIGALLRNQVVAIVGVLIVAFVVEPTLINLVPNVGRFTPIGAAPAGLVGTDFGGHGDDLLSPGIAGLVMAGWLTGLFATSGALLRRRDLT